MKKAKQIASLLLAGTMAVSLAACNNDTTTSTDEPGTSENVVAEVEGSTAA